MCKQPFYQGDRIYLIGDNHIHRILREEEELSDVICYKNQGIFYKQWL